MNEARYNETKEVNGTMNKAKLNVTKGQGNINASKGSKSKMNEINSITNEVLLGGFNEKYAIDRIERIARIVKILSKGPPANTPVNRRPPHGIGIMLPGKKINK